MENQEIVYVCKSINNKNVRAGELKILRKSDKDKLCFEFGEDEINLKKRFYDNEKDFENDFKTLLSIKRKLDGEEENTKKMKNEEEIEEEIKNEKSKKMKNNYF